MASASERRQRDRIVGFETNWAYLRFQPEALIVAHVGENQVEPDEAIVESWARTARQPYPGMVSAEQLAIPS